MAGVREVLFSLQHRYDQSAQWCDDYKSWLQLAGCVAHVPGILTADSQSTLAVKSAALLALLATDAKVLSELLKHSHGCLAKQCVYDIPKTLLYMLAGYYDYVRLTGTPKIVPTDSLASKHMHLSKITQCFQLGLEVILRVLAYLDTVDHVASDHHRVSFYLSELADWVELWRLLGRFGVLSDQDATFDERLGEIKQSLARSLNSISSDLAKRSIDLSMRDEFSKAGATEGSVSMAGVQ
jgi:hypothetical protein